MKIKPSTKRDFQKGDTHIEEQINNLLIETSEEETENTSSTSSEENLNLIQQDDQPSSTDDEEIQQINTLTREQDLLFTIINSYMATHKQGNKETSNNQRPKKMK